WRRSSPPGPRAQRTAPSPSGRPVARPTRTGCSSTADASSGSCHPTARAAPLMALHERVGREGPVVCRPPLQPPFEVAAAFQHAIDDGATVAAIPTGATRDLTNPLDLVEENFPYLEGFS